MVNITVILLSLYPFESLLGVTLEEIKCHLSLSKEKLSQRSEWESLL